MKYCSIFLAFALAALISPQSRAEFGVVDAVPAATLLLPYFEVDLNSTSAHTTLFSINNADTTQVIAHVTYWTNAGVATFSYDIVLEGLDVHTVNIRDFIGSGTYSTGNFGGSEMLSAGQLLAVSAAHTGQADPDTNLCSGIDFGDNVARGYITIDAMNEAGAGFPFEDGYFVDGGTGKASNRNVLWGDYAYVDPVNNFAESERMVHVEAQNFIFKGQTVVDSFYRFFVSQDGSDNREFLPGIWGAGYDQRAEGFAGTALIYWREPGGMVDPFTCGVGPSNFPLLTNEIVAFDEEENPDTVADKTLFPDDAGLTNVTALNLPFEKGWLYLDLRLGLVVKGTPTFENRQAFVFIRNDSEGRFGRGFAATPLTSIFGK